MSFRCMEFGSQASGPTRRASFHRVGACYPIFDTPEQQKQKAAAEAQVTVLKDAIESDQTSLRIVPMAVDGSRGISWRR